MLLACLKGRVTVRLTPVGKVGRTGQLPRVDRDLTAGQESSRSWSVSQFAFSTIMGRRSAANHRCALPVRWHGVGPQIAPKCPKVPPSACWWSDCPRWFAATQVLLRRLLTCYQKYWEILATGAKQTQFQVLLCICVICRSCRHPAILGAPHTVSLLRIAARSQATG
jgi:hypothetical protein